jgi:hypothetical protein
MDRSPLEAIRAFTPVFAGYGKMRGDSSPDYAPFHPGYKLAASYHG